MTPLRVPMSGRRKLYKIMHRTSGNIFTRENSWNKAVAMMTCGTLPRYNCIHVLVKEVNPCPVVKQ